MDRLPDVLTDEFPAVELGALRLDGLAFPLGNGHLAADALDGAATRAAAAFGRHSPRLIAELGTAAWILGATDRPPARHEFCVAFEERARLAPGARDVLREVAIAPGDIRAVAGRRVTTPERTALDLARFRGDDYDAEIVVRLLDRPGVRPSAVPALLDARRHLRHARRARERLSAALAELSPR